MKAMDRIPNTTFYALHSGNHNSNGNPHPQYSIKDLNLTDSKGHQVQPSGFLENWGIVDIAVSNGKGESNITFDKPFSTIFGGNVNVTLVDNSGYYIYLYYGNIICNILDSNNKITGGTIRLINTTNTPTAGSIVKVFYRAIGIV